MASAFPFSMAWEQTRESLSLHHPLILPVAAALLFLPQLLFARYGGDLDPGSVAGMEASRLGPALVLLLAAALGQVITQIYVSLIALGEGGPTLGATLARSVALAPKGLAISLLQSLALAPAIPLLTSPATAERLVGLPLLAAGFWLVLRLIYAIPILATRNRGVFAALQESFARTSGQVLRIGASIGLLLFGFLLLLVVIGSLMAILAQFAGVLGGDGAADGWGPARWLQTLVQTAIAVGLSVILAAFVAILFRQSRDQSRDQPRG